MKPNVTITSSSASEAGGRGNGSGASTQEFPPLVQRLLNELHWPLLDEDGIPGFVQQVAAQGALAVLFCTGDAKRYPEILDVAVVLPELVKHYGGRLMPAVVARGADEALQKQYEFYQWPSLVFFRDGEHVETITKMQDWDVYLQRIDALMPPAD